MGLRVVLPNDKEGRLEFQHQKFNAPMGHLRLSGKAALVTHQTRAVVLLENGEEFLAGEAFCARGDNFSRALGREIALKHMLQLDKPEGERPVSRSLTGQILQVYYNRPRGRTQTTKE